MVSSALDSGIRKAAIVLARLDRQACDLLLDRVTPEQADRVRRTLLLLGDVDPDEERRAIEEFCAAPRRAPQGADDGVELDDRLAGLLAGAGPAPVAATPAPTAEPPFQFLCETAAEKLAAALAGERPQAVALVLAHLPPQRAGEVLACLPRPLQVEVIHRLAVLEPADPEVLEDLQRTLALRLTPGAEGPIGGARGLSAAAAILKAAGLESSRKILGELAGRDPLLAEMLAPPPGSVSLASLSDAQLAEVLAAAPYEVVAVAMVGAGKELAGRVLPLLPPSQSERLAVELRAPLPTRLSEIDDARQQLEEIAAGLREEGKE